jgi:hypothetical protein
MEGETRDPPEAVQTLVETITGADAEVSHDYSHNNRHTFKYRDGVINAHYVAADDDHMLVGFGERWFAIEEV